MSCEKISLHWDGPFSFRDILTNDEIEQKFSCSGVYLWVETLPNGVRQTSYIGKATSCTKLWNRHLQHYASLIGGLYNIPKEFCNWGEAWIPDKKMNDVAEIVLDKKRFMNVVEAGFKRAAATEIYFCRLSDNEANLATVERLLLYEHKPSGTKRGTISDPKRGISITHLNKPWGSV